MALRTYMTTPLCFQHPEGVKCFVCHVCGRAYRTRAGLMVHTRIKHNIIKERPLLQFRCKVCTKTFPYSTQLTRHMSVHKGMGRQLADVDIRGPAGRQYCMPIQIITKFSAVVTCQMKAQFKISPHLHIMGNYVHQTTNTGDGREVKI